MCMSDIIAVTNRQLCTRPFLEQMERVCLSRPKAVILREKDLPEDSMKNLQRRYWQYAGPARCLYPPHLSGGCKASWLQGHSSSAPLLREYAGRLDGFPVIGTSVHSVEDALEAQGLGATYMTAGHIYATDCKKGLPPRGTEFLRQVCGQVHIPVYAIGRY